MGTAGHLTGDPKELESPPPTPTDAYGELELCGRHDRRSQIEAGFPREIHGRGRRRMIARAEVTELEPTTMRLTVLKEKHP
jgi:hypothetical protein